MFGSDQKSTCRKKARYSSEAAAKAALNKINPSRKLGKPRRAYKCPNCGNWHLSSKASL